MALCAVRYGICALIVIAAGILLILEFGNSQWHKWIYMYQSYGDSHGPENRMRRDYTGVWRMWSPNGERSEVTLENGERRGRQTNWFSNGQRSYEAEWRGSSLHGPELTWYDNGQLFRFRYYQNGKLDGPELTWALDGQLIGNGVWKDNTPWHGSFVTELGRVVKSYENGKEVARHRLGGGEPPEPPERPKWGSKSGIGVAGRGRSGDTILNY